MSPSLMPLFAFVAAAAGVVGVYSIVSDVYLRDRARAARRVDEEFRKRLRVRAEKSMLFKDLREFSTDVAVVDSDRTSWHQKLEAMVEQSGLELTPNRLLAIAGGSAFALGLLGAVIRRDPLAAAVGALIGAAVPVLYVNIMRNKRQEKLLSQLPDAFDLMSRVIRAGQTMAQALLAVSDEFSAPVAGEFAFCYEQQNLGLSAETAMRELARRTGLIELKIFVLAMLVQQQTGGNLAEMLDKLAGIIRERYKMRGKIKALTAEGRMQALVLLALPPGMFLLMLTLNRSFTGILLEHPTLLWTIVISESIGALWIRKIVNFDI